MHQKEFVSYLAIMKQVTLNIKDGQYQFFKGRVKLIEQLEDVDKQATFRIIDARLTKFKNFFNQNVAAL